MCCFGLVDVAKYLVNEFFLQSMTTLFITNVWVKFVIELCLISVPNRNKSGKYLSLTKKRTANE